MVPSPVCLLSVSYLQQIDTTYETRFKENIHPRKRKYAQLDKSFLCKAPTLWSNLKTEIKECLNTGLFVKNYKRFSLHG